MNICLKRWLSCKLASDTLSLVTFITAALKLMIQRGVSHTRDLAASFITKLKEIFKAAKVLNFQIHEIITL